MNNSSKKAEAKMIKAIKSGLVKEKIVKVYPERVISYDDRDFDIYNEKDIQQIIKNIEIANRENCIYEV